MAGNVPAALLKDDDEGDDSRPRKSKGGFHAMDLSKPVFRGLMRKGYRMPTPVQRKAIPAIKSGRDVVAMARTGSGKTAAFLVPLFERLREHATVVGVRAVVLSPTRELAMQTLKFTKDIGYYINPPLETCLLVGGDSIEDQFDLLSRNPDIIIATPGRLMHHLLEAELSLKRCEYVVFDEADRLFELGFAAQLHEILKRMPEGRQTVLVSATMPSILAEFARAGLHRPQVVRLDADQKMSEDLALAFFTVRPTEKVAALACLFLHIINQDERAVVFTATRHHVEFVAEVLRRIGVVVSLVYGSMDPTARKINVGKFRANKSRVLVVTDIAARGIDIPMLDAVVNYDFPAKPKLFVHRAGRTARAGRTGTAYSFVQPDELAFLVDLELGIGRPIRPADEAPAPVEGLPVLQPSVAHVGTIPKGALSAQVAEIEQLIAADDELSAMQRQSANAYKLYQKTRPSASPASVARSKALSGRLQGSVHPLALGLQPEPAEAERGQLLSLIAGFRPPASVIETAARVGPAVEAAKLEKITQQRNGATEHAKRSNARRLAAASKPSDGVDHADADADEDALRAPMVPAVSSKKKRAVSFRDNAFFLAPSKADRSEVPHTGEEELRVHGDGQASRIAAAVLDLNDDERAALGAKQAQIRWDRRKRKYVKQYLGLEDLTSDRPLRPKAKNESGVQVPGTKKHKAEVGTLYKTWKRKENRRIQAPGEEEDLSHVGARPKVGMRKRWYKAPEVNKGAKSEIKPLTKITKERKVMARKKAFYNAKRGGGRGANGPGKGRGTRGGGRGGRGRGTGRGGVGAGASRGRRTR